MDRSIRTTLAAVALAASVTLLVPADLAAAGNHTTPALNPEPPDYYSCITKGAGTYCSGETVVAYGPDPSGLFCGTGPSSFEVLDQAVRRTKAERWYDTAGNLVKRKLVFSFENASVSSPSGARVGYSQRDIQTDVFGVPGDASTGTTYANGSLRITVPGMGAVFLDKGRVVWGPDGSLMKEAGRHDLVDYFNGDASSLTGLCQALGA